MTSPRRLLAALDAATLPGRAPPEGRWAQLRYGAAQPLLGMRALLTRRALWRFVPAPALGMLLLCVLATRALRAVSATPRVPVVGAYVPPGASLGRTFATVLGVLAAGPVILFARHHARLAAHARAALGFGDARARLQPLREVVREAGEQWELQVAPIFLVAMLGTALRAARPSAFDAATFEAALRLGTMLAVPVWIMPFTMVEALDTARIEGYEPVATPRPPALARWTRWLGLGYVLARWSRAWWGKLAFVEERAWLSAGFLASTAALCCVPVLQFAFRPALIVGASHLLGHLEAAARRDARRAADAG